MHPKILSGCGQSRSKDLNFDDVTAHVKDIIIPIYSTAENHFFRRLSLLNFNKTYLALERHIPTNCKKEHRSKAESDRPQILVL